MKEKNPNYLPNYEVDTKGYFNKAEFARTGLKFRPITFDNDGETVFLSAHRVAARRRRRQGEDRLKP